jgi:hypothetical protein
MRRIILTCLLAMAPAASFAVPVTYDLSYASEIGPSGVGSAIWDADSRLLSEFTWDLGVGIVGGILSSNLSSNAPGGGTVGSFVWELVSGDTTADPSDVVAIGFNPQGLFGFNGFVSFRQTGIYTFSNDMGPTTTGRVSIAPRVSVAEPASLAMFALSLFGLALARRRTI